VKWAWIADLEGCARRTLEGSIEAMVEVVFRPKLIVTVGVHIKV